MFAVFCAWHRCTTLTVCRDQRAHSPRCCGCCAFHGVRTVCTTLLASVRREPCVLICSLCVTSSVFALRFQLWLFVVVIFAKPGSSVANSSLYMKKYITRAPCSLWMTVEHYTIMSLCHVPDPFYRTWLMSTRSLLWVTMFLQFECSVGKVCLLAVKAAKQKYIRGKNVIVNAWFINCFYSLFTNCC